jgi:REP element-mobilizing transposase RayT
MYRYDALQGKVRRRVGEIIKPVCYEMGVTIFNEALSSNPLHKFLEIPPSVSAYGAAVGALA